MKLVFWKFDRLITIKILNSWQERLFMQKGTKRRKKNCSKLLKTVQKHMKRSWHLSVLMAG